MNPKASSIEEYFSWQTEANQEKLQSIRQVILEVASEAKEVISFICLHSRPPRYWFTMLPQKNISDFTHTAKQLLLSKKNCHPIKPPKGRFNSHWTNRFH